jgi:U3 small nucleolar RNA-associated protein 22
LRPSKNNVRPRSWVDEIQRRKERGIVADAKEMDVSKLPPTPNYNAAILEDIVMPLHHQLLSRTVQSFEHIRGALMLLKVWLRQRQLVHSAIGFDTHTISLLLAYLVQTKRISTTAAPEIIFQTVLTFLTTFDAVTNVLDFTGTAFVPRTQLSSEDKTYTTPQGFMLRHPVSLQPPTGDNPIVVMYNVFWRVHDSSMTLLQNEATKALHDLTGSHRPGAFDRMFLQKRGFQDSFDQIFILQVPSWSEVLNKVMYSVDTDEENGSGVPSFAEQRKDAIETASLHWPVEAFFATETYALLKKALGDRIIHLSVSVMPLSGSSSGSGIGGGVHNKHEKDAKYPAFASPSECMFILVGVLLDKEKHQRKVERGPPAVPASEVSCCGESPAERAVREFKDFWGDQAQLRRFKDGSILESVVWEDAEFSPLAHDLIENIARYIVSRHLHAAVGDVYAAAGDRHDSDDDDDDDEHLLGAVSRQGNFWARMGHLSTTELLAAPLSTTARSSSSGSSSSSSSSSSSKLDLQIVTAYDELRNVLVNKLQRIPLRIDTLLAYSPELRYASLYPIEPHLYVQLKYLFSLDADAEYKPLIRPYVGCPFSLVTSPIPVIAKFEASSKWPTDAAAIRKCKTAFLLKVKEELWSQSQVLSIIHEDSLDVLVQGYIFRVYPMATFETERIALLNTAPTNRTLRCSRRCVCVCVCD